MEETDASVQIYSFFEVTAVHHDEKLDKDRQRFDMCDIVTNEHTVLDSLTESTSWQHNRLHNTSCMYMFPKYVKPFPLKGSTRCTKNIPLNIFEKQHANNSD